MESRNSTPDAIDFRSFTWTSTVQTAGIEESCPSGAELPVGARMIRIKWINLLEDADDGRIGFLSMCTIIILPKIPNQASHHMATLHRNMTCRSLKRLGWTYVMSRVHVNVLHPPPPLNCVCRA